MTRWRDESRLAKQRPHRTWFCPKTNSCLMGYPNTFTYSPNPLAEPQLLYHALTVVITALPSDEKGPDQHTAERPPALQYSPYPFTVPGGDGTDPPILGCAGPGLLKSNLDLPQTSIIQDKDRITTLVNHFLKKVMSPDGCSCRSSHRTIKRTHTALSVVAPSLFPHPGPAPLLSQPPIRNFLVPQETASSLPQQPDSFTTTMETNVRGLCLSRKVPFPPHTHHPGVPSFIQIFPSLYLTAWMHLSH